VKSVLRRFRRDATGMRAGPLAYGDLTIDVERCEVRRDGNRLGLTATELRLLTALVQAEGRVMTRQTLMDAVYGPAQGDALERTIDVHIGRLREKLGGRGGGSRYIATVRGAGYRAAIA
jgi:DNA-binding response OmpR family regulator